MASSQYVRQSTVPADINEQVRVAVIRLQQSMDQVVGRLNALEARVSSQSSNEVVCLMQFDQCVLSTSSIDELNSLGTEETLVNQASIIWTFASSFGIHGDVAVCGSMACALHQATTRKQLKLIQT